MSEKLKRTISISFDKSQIASLDEIASQHRRETGENMTRSEVVRQIVDQVLNRQKASLFPASQITPEGGRTDERSDGGAGGIQHGQGR